MNVYKVLFDSYNYAEKIGLVDDDTSNGYLLPVYHNMNKVENNKIIKVEINIDSSLYRSYFLDKFQDDSKLITNYVVYPVTKESVSRTGREQASHPLCDNIKFIFDNEGALLTSYEKNIENWIDYENNKEIKLYLTTILKFLKSSNSLNQIIESLFVGDFTLNNYSLEYSDKTIDISKLFIEFAIVSFKGSKDISVSSYKELHKSFIEFTNSNEVINGVCNISGEDGFIVSTHRKIKGNSKLICKSDKNPGAYEGRLNKGSSMIKVSHMTSEKIHIMLKYLLNNKNSCYMLSKDQYLITWFSEDINNSKGIDITYRNSNDSKFDFLDGIIEDSEKPKPANIDTYYVTQSFRLGRANYSKESDFYCMILDFSCKGRAAVKYFNSLKVSQLKENLEKWEKRYSWGKYNAQTKKFEPFTPSFYSVFINAYGVERTIKNDRKLDYGNKDFMNSQYVSLVTSLLNANPMPKNIENKFKENIRHRNRYKDIRIWNNLLFVARAVLKNSNGENFTRMIDKDNNDRSYLLGRLLSVYHNIELSTYSSKELNKEINKEGKEESTQRLTNAEKFWTNYLDRPATTITILEKKTNSYMNKLKTTNYRMYKGLDIIKSQLLTKISENYKLDDKSFNMPLDYKFLFGYTAQNSYIYGLKNQVDKERENDK